MGELGGRRALVTGGTSGIGRSIAGAFVREGARVVITGRAPELGERTANRLGVRFIRADAGQPDQIRASVDQALEHLGGLDILVNNAGISVQATALQTPLEDFQRLMDVNLRGPFLYAKACFPHLETNRGCMIHISSDASIQGEEPIAIYSVSKAALDMLSNMLAIEGGRRGVRSNVICPGDTAPGMRHAGPPGDDDRPEDDPSTWPVPPIGRVGSVTDVAEAAVWLASDRASFVNGVRLVVDGGMRAGLNTASPPDPPNTRLAQW
jgi:NAD(P)-dependent dehydrogenase (short-subunit alcohol dehydrogenase family)